MRQLSVTTCTHVHLRADTWPADLGPYRTAAPAELSDRITDLLLSDPVGTEVGALVSSRPLGDAGTETHFAVAIETVVEVHTADWARVFGTDRPQPGLASVLAQRIQERTAGWLQERHVQGEVHCRWTRVKPVPSTRMVLLYAPGTTHIPYAMHEADVAGVEPLAFLLQHPRVVRWRTELGGTHDSDHAVFLLNSADTDAGSYNGTYPVLTVLTTPEAVAARDVRLPAS